MSSAVGPVDQLRHCAFCLKICSAAKLCGGCKRRAYCSRECQITDWKIQPEELDQKGQGHKIWCRTKECGEEDVDWEVVPVPGKGLGVVAKKFMPARYRIIVEPVVTHPDGHPGVKDLVPENGTLEEKFKLNAISPESVFGKGHGGLVGLRICRANHSCDPNADHRYDDTARVLILSAQRDIQPGEEICNSYCAFNDLNIERSLAKLSLSAEDEFHLCKEALKTKWGIVCPPDCFCNDSKIRSLVVKGRQLSADIERLAGQGRLAESIRSAEHLLNVQEQIHSPLIDRAKAHHCAFQVAVNMGAKGRSRAELHLCAARDIYAAVLPHSKFTRMTEEAAKSLFPK